MYKLDLEKAEKPEITLSASIESYKKQGNSGNISTSASLTMLKFSTVDHNNSNNNNNKKKLWKILQEMGTPDHLTCLLRNLYAEGSAKMAQE